ncbi:hypothetical protein QJS10_CPB18g01071 [Acorus calamus]|uniref:Uncharacterized protein n=1 Tax=Acorus calamus TaxID=4465 RepID=A0AAV9CL12_ACOCL|nr:hypothetical protein QJS10_CPB18g01071 [Acorus calamus]
MALSCQCIHVSASARRPSISPDFDSQKSLLSSTVKPLLKELQARPMRVDVPQTLRNASRYLLDAFVDSVFKFADQPLLPSQSNFAPVGEIGEAVEITSIEGEIPIDFPEGPNPLFGGLQSTVSVFGRSSEIWVEGEGMLHAVHFTKDSRGKWSVFYKNKYVDTETFRIEKECNRPSFLPAIEGDAPAILAAYLLICSLTSSNNSIECQFW